MKYAVIAHVNGMDVGIDEDGTMHHDLERAQLYNEDEAKVVAQKFASYRPTIAAEDWLFPEIFEDDDE